MLQDPWLVTINDSECELEVEMEFLFCPSSRLEITAFDELWLTVFVYKFRYFWFQFPTDFGIQLNPGILLAALQKTTYRQRQGRKKPNEHIHSYWYRTKLGQHSNQDLPWLLALDCSLHAIIAAQKEIAATRLRIDYEDARPFLLSLKAPLLETLVLHSFIDLDESFWIFIQPYHVYSFSSAFNCSAWNVVFQYTAPCTLPVTSKIYHLLRPRHIPAAFHWLYLVKAGTHCPQFFRQQH